MTDEPKPKWWKRTNWWKVAFFVLLIVFEFRELLVVQMNERPLAGGIASVYSAQGLTVARGTWKRLDNGSEMVPASVTIQCWEERGQCHEATANMFDGKSLMPPEIDTFDAKFGPDAVTYENDDPICAKYSVRIDLKLEKVIAVRDRKADAKGEMCANLEPHIEMMLVSATDIKFDPLKGHFLPLFQILKLLFDRS